LLSLLFAGALGLRVIRTVPGEGPDGKPVFYAIVMGKLALRHQVSLWLSSLRKLGGYKDEVVMITDKPTCLAKTLTEAKLLGSLISSTSEVDIYRPGKDYVGNIHLVKRPFQNRIYLMKMEKTRAWLNVKNAAIPHPVTSIIYTDEDIVIGKDLASFINVVRESEKAKHTLGLFADNGNSDDSLHTGVVVMFPGEATDLCLQAWGKSLIKIGELAHRKGMSGGRDIADTTQPHAFNANVDDTKEKEPVDMARKMESGHLTDVEMDVSGADQHALQKTRACTTKNTGMPDQNDGIKMFDQAFFWFPDQNGLEVGKTAEFVHFTNTARWKSIDHTLIKDYLTKQGIPAEVDPMGVMEDTDACNTDHIEATQA